MKEILKDTLLILLCAFVTSVGLVALTIAMDTEPKKLIIFIPSLIISWLVLYPTYKHWYNVFKNLFKF